MTGAIGIGELSRRDCVSFEAVPSEGGEEARFSLIGDEGDRAVRR